MIEWKIKGLYKADPEAVYNEITALGDSFSPASIVEAARDETSELHKCFEWDDTVAAQKYREHQARMLVAQLVVKVETEDNLPVAVRVISSTAAKNVFTPTNMLLKSEQEYVSLLARAKAELESFSRKYATVSELHAVFEAIDML